MRYKEYQRALARMVYKFFFYRKTRSGASVNEKQAEELHKSVVKKFKKRRVYGRFTDNIQEADLAEMGSMSSKVKNARYLICMD